MHIRHLEPVSDLPQILAFLPELYEMNFPGFKADAEFMNRKRAQLRQVPRDPGQVVLVCEDGHRVCGFIWLVIEEESSGRRRGEVAAIHVDRRYRQKGLGRQLMDEGEQMLRTYGCDRVFLMVTTENAVAVDLYAKMGYEVTRQQMEKSLRGTR